MMLLLVFSLPMPVWMLTVSSSSSCCFLLDPNLKWHGFPSFLPIFSIPLFGFTYWCFLNSTIMACNFLLDLVNLATSDNVASVRSHQGMIKPHQQRFRSRQPKKKSLCAEPHKLCLLLLLLVFSLLTPALTLTANLLLLTMLLWL